MHLRKGFTLIELLVVIAIIGLLSSVVFASLNSARDKARDARRLADLRQLEIAFELFYDDNGYYPRETTDGANGRIGEGAGVDSMLSPYMPSVPHDPAGPGNSTYYYYDGRQNCGGSPNVAAFAAVELEADSGNRTELCNGSWGGEGGIGSGNSYNVVLGPSDG